MSTQSPLLNYFVPILLYACMKLFCTYTAVCLKLFCTYITVCLDLIILYLHSCTLGLSYSVPTLLQFCHGYPGRHTARATKFLCKAPAIDVTWTQLWPKCLQTCLICANRPLGDNYSPSKPTYHKEAKQSDFIKVLKGRFVVECIWSASYAAK